MNIRDNNTWFKYRDENEVKEAIIRSSNPGYPIGVIAIPLRNAGVLVQGNAVSIETNKLLDRDFRKKFFDALNTSGSGLLRVISSYWLELSKEHRHRSALLDYLDRLPLASQVEDGVEAEKHRFEEIPSRQIRVSRELLASQDEYLRSGDNLPLIFRGFYPHPQTGIHTLVTGVMHKEIGNPSFDEKIAVDTFFGRGFVVSAIVETVLGIDPGSLLRDHNDNGQYN